MMKMITVNLMVEDVDATVDFYRDVLGFELVASVPENSPLAWAMMRSGDAAIMFQSKESIAEEYPDFAEREIGGTLVLYVRMQGVDKLYERIKGHAKVTMELRTTFYGMKEFAIEDLNGYVLTFAEETNQ